MGYPTKVQLIKRRQSEQWYINFPVAVAQAMEFERGETVEWTIEDKAQLVLRRLKVPASALKKTGTMTEEFERFFDQTRSAFAQERTFVRAKTLAMSALVGLGRRTVTGMLCASAQRFDDWSAAYRLFEQQRFNREALFAPARRGALERVESHQPVVAMMDDTLIHKRGRKVHGAGWRRDPLGPPFTANFIWGQRFLQISAAVPAATAIGQARGVPVDLVHAPSAAKPRKSAPAEMWREYRRQQQTMKISAIGAARVAALRSSLDEEPHGRGRLLIVSVDGGFTNRTVFRCPPPNTTLIGRIRKDARLFSAVAPTPRRGRPRWFGAPLPTPEQIRQDNSICWSTVEGLAPANFIRLMSKPWPRFAGLAPEHGMSA